MDMILHKGTEVDTEDGSGDLIELEKGEVILTSNEVTALWAMLKDSFIQRDNEYETVREALGKFTRAISENKS